MKTHEGRLIDSMSPYQIMTVKLTKVISSLNLVIANNVFIWAVWLLWYTRVIFTSQN